MRQFFSKPKNSVQFGHFKQNRQNIKNFNKTTKKGSRPMTHFKQAKHHFRTFAILLVLFNFSVFSQPVQSWIARYTQGNSNYLYNNNVRINKDLQDNIIVNSNING